MSWTTEVNSTLIVVFRLTTFHLVSNKWVIDNGWQLK